MRSSSSYRSDWDIIREELLYDLETQCTELYREAKRSDSGNAGDFWLRLNFEEMAEQTECREYLDGMDFRTDQAPRALLYDKRVEIAQIHKLWFDSIHGRGLAWTRHAVLGTRRYENRFFQEAGSRTAKLEQLWQEGAELLPEPVLEELCTSFQLEHQREVMALRGRRRQHDALFRDLVREGDLPAPSGE